MVATMPKERTTRGQQPQQALRRISNGRVTHYCWRCKWRALGHEDLPPASTSSAEERSGQPFTRKCECGAYNVCMVGRSPATNEQS
jgi:hypothetical protein